MKACVLCGRVGPVFYDRDVSLCPRHWVVRWAVGDWSDEEVRRQLLAAAELLRPVNGPVGTGD